MLPWAAQMTGFWSMIIAVIVIRYTTLLSNCISLDNKYATQLMFMSFIYLPILFSLLF